MVVRFATHEQALAVRRAASSLSSSSIGQLAGVCSGANTLFNDREYDDTEAEAHRSGTAREQELVGRGWYAHLRGVTTFVSWLVRACVRACVRVFGV